MSAGQPLRGKTADRVRDARIGELEKNLALMHGALTALIESHKIALQLINMLTDQPAISFDSMETVTAKH